MRWFSTSLAIASMGETIQLEYGRHEHLNLDTDAEGLLQGPVMIGKSPGDLHFSLLVCFCCRT